MSRSSSAKPAWGALGDVRPAALIFLLALAPRLIAVAARGPIHFDGDESAYFGLARNLLAHHTYSTSLHAPYLPSVPWPPGYAAFLALLLACGLGLKAITVAQAGLSALTAVVVYAMARRLWGAGYGLVGGAVCALYPGAIYSCAWLLSDTLFEFLVAVGLAAAVAAWSARGLAKPRVRWAAWAGAAMGLAMLCRAAGAPSFAGMAAAGWLAGGRTGRRAALAFAAVGVAVIAPYLLRCRIVTGRWVFLQGGGTGMNLYNGSVAAPTPEAVFAVTQQQPFNARYREAMDVSGSAPALASADREAARAAWRNIRAAPAMWLKLRLVGIARTCLPNFHLGPPIGTAVREHRWGRLLLKLGLMFGFGLAPLLLGLIGLLRERSAPCLIAGACWATALVTMFPVGNDQRYWYPMLPALLVTAICGWRWLGRPEVRARSVAAG